MSENQHEEIYAVDKLFCTICQHDLNHPLYLIRSHPILSVPLCIICHEDILKSELFDEDADVSDFCTWCGDGGDLLLCSDEEHCNRAFCRDCLTSNLGNDVVKEIENTDDWKCLCCDTSVLTPFTAALELGTAKSVYNQPLAESNNNTNETKNDNGDNSDSDDNPEAARGMYILQSIVKECDNMTNTLSETALNDKIAQIRDELRQSADPENRMYSIHVAAEEEMHAWQAHWTRHYDILQTQEAALHDHLSSLGYDPQQLQSYSLSDEALAGQLTAREKVAKAAADLELNSAPTESKKKKSTTDGETSQMDGKQSSSTAPLWATPKRPALKSKKVKVQWEEAVVEVDTEQRLPALTAQALQDPLVLQYQDRDIYADIDPCRYPESFCDVTPITVIKAYFYASASERRSLARSYCVLPHICIILSSLSAHRSFPHSTDQWSFAATVHPAVRLALFYAESATTSLILCQHYQLNDDYCQVTEFGSTAEVLSTYNSTRKAHNKQRAKSGFGEKHEERFTIQQLRDAEDCEERTDNYLLQEYFSNEKTQTKDNTHICTICTQKPCVCISKSDQIRKRLQPVIKNDAEDEEKGLKERLKSVKFVMGKRKRSAEEERRRLARHTERHGSAKSCTTTTITTAGLLEAGEKRVEKVVVKCEPNSDRPIDLANDNKESECLQTATHVEAAITEKVIAAGEGVLTNQKKTVLDPVGEDFGGDSVGDLEEESNRDGDTGGSSGASEPMELSEEAAVSVAAETVTVAAQSANQPVATTPAKTGKSSSARSAPTSTAPPNSATSHSLVSSASAVKTAAPNTNPAQTPGSTNLPHTAPSGNMVVFDLTLDSDEDEGGAPVSEVELPSSDSTKKTHEQIADVLKKTEQTDSESELTEELKATAPLPLPGGAPLFVPKAPPARPAQSIAGLQSTKRDDSHGLSKTPNKTPLKFTGGKIDNFFQARRAHTVSLPADAHITTVDSEVEDLEEEFEEGPGSGQKPPLFEGKKQRGRPSKMQRSTVPLWSKETLQVNAAERQRRKELNCHKYFNEDSGFALNQERPEGDGAVMLIEDFTEKLKDHQKEGVRFLWKNVLGSVKMATRSADSGSGCIVAHCMGLGKTLTVIAFTATLLTNPLVQAIEDPWRPPEPKQSSAAAAGNTNTSSSSSSSSSSSIGSTTVPLATTTTIDTSATTIVTSPPPPPPPAAIPRKRLIHTVLIVAPKNTLDNWIIEYKRWTPPELHGALNITSIMSNPSEKGSATWVGRLQRLRDWHSTGGVMVMGYEMFRILTNLENTKAVKEDARANATTATAATEDGLGVEPVPSSNTGNTGSTDGAGVSLAHIREARMYLQDPGPDLVVADEAHVIKEKNSVINQMVSQIRTKRRIALTGSPLQNNLMEYWCMINWVKYRFLGDFKEFRRYYVEPIKAGSDKKAVSSQVRKMKQRTHILNKKLTPIVDRKDMRTLEKDLQPKREFTICIRMTTFQQYLYKYFLTLLDQFSNKTQRLLVGYNCLLRIWNHPACAVMHDFKETNTQLRAAAKSSNTNLAAAGTTGTIGGMDRWTTTTAAAVGGEQGSSSSSALATGIPRAILKAPTVRPVKCTLQYVREQLTSTVRHFQRDDTRLLAEVQQSASQVEESLLKKPSVAGASSGASSGIGEERDPVLLDSDTDDSRLTSSSKRESLKRSRRRIRSEGGDGDISIGTEDSDDSSSLDGFVVGDDEIEYDDASETELGDGKSKKRRRSSSGSSGRRKMKRLHKGGKRIRSDDETASEGEGSDHSGSRGAAAETSRPSTALLLDPELAEQTADEGSDSDGGESIENPPVSQQLLPVIHATGTTQSSASTSGNQGETTDLSEDRKGASPNADSRAVSPRSTEDTAAVADRADSPQRVDTLLSELAATQSQDDLAEEHADAMARSLAISSDWWKKIATTTDDKDSLDPEYQRIIDSLQLLKLSNKMVTLLSLLALSVLQGDKMLVFSQSLYSLDAIEMFLGMSHWDRLIEAVQEGRYERRKFSQWQLNREYLRIDGATGQRQKCIDKFNKKGSSYHLMLISTKAGNMGINLQAANRVVIFDTSWNPVHDLQAMYRAYRYGQTKPVFVYRLLSAGSMEERIYKMQVIKQSLAARVVDAQMPDNHFSAEETLLSFDVQDDATEKMDRAAQVLEGAVKDEVLGTFVRHFASDLLTSIEDHSGLLEDNKDEHLNAEEQEQAEADLLVEMGRVSAEHLAQQAALAALKASLASGAQGQAVLNVPVNMTQQQFGGGVSSSSSSSGMSAQAIPWSERMFNVHNAGGGAAHTGTGLPTLPPIGQLTPAGVPAGSAAEHAYIQQQVQLQQRQQLQVQQRMLYQQQQEQMYTERLHAAMEKNRTQQASSARDSTLLPSLVKKVSQGQKRREHPTYTAQVNEIMARVAAKTSARSSSQTPVPVVAPIVPVSRAAAGLPSGSAAGMLPIPTHHSLPSASTATAPVHPAQQAGVSASTSRSASAVPIATAPPPPSAAAVESAQRTKEDILLLFSQTVMPDPSYVSSVRLLSSQIRNTATTYTANALEQRHAELIRSGRAAELFQLPALRTYIEQYRKNNPHASGSGGLQ